MRKVRSDYIERVIVFWRGLLLVMIGGVLGCASQPIPQPLIVTFNAAADLNPDIHNRPLSIVIRVYSLKDKKAFQRLSLQDFSLGKPDEELFEQELVSRQEHVLVPGHATSIDIPASLNTQYVGVVAFYRQPDMNRWRLLLDKKLSTGGITLSVGRCGLLSVSNTVLALPGQQLNRPLECLPANPASVKSPELPSSLKEPKIDAPIRRILPAKKAWVGV